MVAVYCKDVLGGLLRLCYPKCLGKYDVMHVLVELHKALGQKVYKGTQKQMLAQALKDAEVIKGRLLRVINSWKRTRASRDHVWQRLKLVLTKAAEEAVGGGQVVVVVWSWS